MVAEPRATREWLENHASLLPSNPKRTYDDHWLWWGFDFKKKAVDAHLRLYRI
jgi:hypothetical protein